MSSKLFYGSWQCESCEDIFEAETQDEEIAMCPACKLECIPVWNSTQTFTFVDANSGSLYMWDGTKYWLINSDKPTCTCSTKTLIKTGCQCGGQ